jgi:NAD-dependent SIR2 family protein deacetylase
LIKKHNFLQTFLITFSIIDTWDIKNLKIQFFQRFLNLILFELFRNLCINNINFYKIYFIKGSFATASCTKCKHKVDGNSIKEKIYNQEIPYCEMCISKNASLKVNFQQQNLPIETQETADKDFPLNSDKGSSKSEEKNIGILKPDIVFFGENLPESYHQAINIDKTKCDLLIVIGSQLKVNLKYSILVLCKIKFFLF